ncbi:MAG: CocE/NonD family hydrolase [Actinomycetes bacterium]
MHRGLRLTVAAALATTPLALVPALADTPPAYTVQTLHFAVTVGPHNNTHCDVIGDLYKPNDASAANPVPAILTTNGFGGSKDDQAGLGKLAASNGYAVLSYSGLGFGGSGCKIELDDPDWDGKAGSQLVSFLGGASGVAYKDAAHTTAAPTVDFVIHDAVAHDGQGHANDPRVGMIGGSYGGQIQFAVAKVDPRLDTIIPIITWSDLSYSLAPNNTSRKYGVTYATPGTEKLEWTSLFFGLGIADGLEGAQTDPSRNVGCPNFDNRACPSKAEMDALGYPTKSTMQLARHASVESYVSRIRIPVLLAQGENDTLFNLNEAAATYRALKAQGTPVQMIWQSWGHSGGVKGPGEYSGGEDALSTYEGQRFFDWFDHYLKGSAVSTGPDFSYYRDWVPFSGSGSDTVQYGTAASYPISNSVSYYLSGTNRLAASRGYVTQGMADFVAPGPAATSYSETSALQADVPSPLGDVRDAPGTFAAYNSAPLAQAVDVVGVPTVTLRVFAPSVVATQLGSPGGHLVLFLKLYDVDAAGHKTLTNRLIAPARVADVTKPFTVTLPGIVHQFAAGHHLQLVVAGSDAAYKGNSTAVAVSVVTSKKAPGLLQLPVVG